MKKKSDRHQAIREIISNNRIGSQEELLELLHKRGYDLTQATLSRDLKVMHVAKIADNSDSYVYVMPDSIANALPQRSPERINYLADGFMGISFSGNLSVIRTLPGYASSIAAVIDNASPSEIIGTIAGDDTILVILKEGISRNELIATVKKIMPYLKDKI